jgi:hypothetical protein
MSYGLHSYTVLLHFIESLLERGSNSRFVHSSFGSQSAPIDSPAQLDHSENGHSQYGASAWAGSDLVVNVKDCS